MAVAFAGIWLVSLMDRSKTARDELIAYEEQFVRSQTGVGATRAVVH
jgi:cation/acetate symporter